MKKDFDLSNINLFPSSHQPTTFTKFALLSQNYKTFPKFFSTLCFGYSQTQILAIFMQIAFLSFQKGKLRWFNIFQYLHGLCSVGDFLDFEAFPNISVFILAVMFSYVFLILILFVSFIVLIKAEKMPSNFAQKIWNFLIYFHSQVCFYPIHFTLIKTLSLIYTDHFQNFSLTTRIVILLFAYPSLVLNCVYALGISICFQVSLKTKNILSAKTTILGVIDIIAKFIYPFITAFFPDIDAFWMIFLVINFGFAFSRDWLYYAVLPYYNFSILQLGIFFYGMCALFAFMSVTCKIIYFDSSEDSVMLPILLWLLVIPLYTKLRFRSFRKMLSNIIFNPNSYKNSYLILHYWHIYKYLAGSSNNSFKKKLFKEESLFYKSLLSNIKYKNIIPVNCTKLLLLKGSAENKEIEEDFILKYSALTIYLEALKSRLEEDPNNSLLKATLALYFVKSGQNYLVADTLIKEGLENSKRFSVRNSLYLIRFEIMNRLDHKILQSGYKENHYHKKTPLSTQKYIQIQQLVNKLKKKIGIQLDTQIQFWKAFQDQQPKFDVLLSLAAEARVQGHKVLNCWRLYNSFTDLKLPEPFLIYGLYQALVTQDGLTSEGLLEEYKKLQNQNHINDTQIDDVSRKISIMNSSWAAVSGLQNEYGKILDCSDNIKNILEVKKELLVGKYIQALLPFFLRGQEDFLGNLETLHTIKEVPIVTGNGYLVNCYMCITMNFLPKFGLCYFLLFEPTNNEKEIILIRENGAIIEFSENVGFELELNLRRNKENFNIFPSCPKLKRIVNAFLEIARKGNKGKEEQEKNNRKYREVFSKKYTTTDTESEGSSTGKDKILNTVEKYQKGNKLPFLSLSNVLKKMQGEEFDIDFLNYHTKIKAYKDQDGLILQLEMTRLFELDISSQKSTIHEQNEEKSPSRLLHFKNARRTSIVPQIALDQFPDFNYPRLNQDKSQMFSLRTEFSSIEPRKNTNANEFLPIFAQTKPEPFLIPQLDSSHTYYTSRDASFVIPPSTLREDKPFLNDKSNMGIASLSPDTFMIKEKVIGLVETKRSNRLEFCQPVMLNPDMDLSFSIQDTIGAPTLFQNVNLGSSELKDREDVTPGSSPMARKRTLINVKKTLLQNIGKTKLTKKEKISNSAPVQDYRKQTVIKELLHSKNLRKRSKAYFFLFILVLICLLTTLLKFSFAGTVVSKKVMKTCKVMHSLSFRTSYINLANQEARLVAAMSTFLHNVTDFLYLEDLIGLSGTAYTAFNRLDKYNKDLWFSLYNVAEDKQDILYEKDIRVFERDSDYNLNQISIDDSFQLVTNIIAKGYLISNRPFPDVADPIMNDDLRFIFDNSLGDLLVCSERITKMIYNHLLNTFSTARNTYLIIFLLSVVVIVLFILLSIKGIFVLNTGLEKFMSMIFWIPIEQRLKEEITLSSFKNLLVNSSDETEYIQTLNYAKIKERVRKKQANNQNNFRFENYSRNFRQASMKMVYHKNFIGLIPVVIGLLILGGIGAIFYLLTLDKVKMMEKQQISINAALRNLEQQTLFSAQLQSLIMDDNSSTIRNQPILDGIEMSIKRLKEVRKLHDSLLNANGELSAENKAILFNFSCKNVHSDLYYLQKGIASYACQYISHGQNHVGLMTLYPELADGLVKFISDFTSMDRSSIDIQEYYIETTEYFVTIIDVTIVLLLLSFESTFTEFNELVSKLQDKEPSFVVISIFSSLIIGVFIGKWIISRLMKKDNEKKCVLSLVPHEIILSNQYLKRYLLEMAREQGKKVMSLEID